MLAAVLQVAPVNMVTPPDGLVALTPKRAVDGAGLRNWLLFGDPLLGTDGQRVRSQNRLLRRLEEKLEALAKAASEVDNKDAKNAILVQLIQAACAYIEESRRLNRGLPLEPENTALRLYPV